MTITPYTRCPSSDADCTLEGFNELAQICGCGWSGSYEEPFQPRVAPWMEVCFGPEISSDRIERNHRFIEEALELVQANGCTREEAHQLVDYVFNRPVGEVHQEIGGVMVTLAALCLAVDEDMHKAGETELARIWTKVDQIRAKQAAKPKHSPLPQSVSITGKDIKMVVQDAVNKATKRERDRIVAAIEAEAEECECDGFSGLARGLRKAIRLIRQ